MTQQGSDKLSQPLYNDCVNMTCSDDDKNILEIHAHNSNNCIDYSSLELGITRLHDELDGLIRLTVSLP